MYTSMRALSAPTSTHLQLQTLLTLFALYSVEKVEVFAGDTAKGAAPLVLLGMGKFAGIGPANVVFDALTLSVDSQARYAEVRELLDLAMSSGKCFFSEMRAPATAGLSPQEAVDLLCGLEPVHPLTHQNRKTFFALLSDLTEVEITDQRGVRR